MNKKNLGLNGRREFLANATVLAGTAALATLPVQALPIGPQPNRLL